MDDLHPDLQQYLRANGFCECCRRKAAARRRLDDGILQIRNRRVHETDSSTPVLDDRKTMTSEEYFAKLERNGIWEKVFKNLTNPSDITSAYFAHDMFSDHLEQKRMSMLLPQVFGILRERKDLHYIQPKDDTEGSNKDIFTLRLVSQAWKVASEEQFLPPSGFSNPNWRSIESTHRWINLKIITTPYKCIFRNAEDVEMALKTHGTTRLPSSSLSFLRVIDIRVKDLSGGERKSFYSNLGRLLDVHGEQVWALHYSFTRRFDYEGLVNLVACMPNLKELFLNCQDQYKDLKNPSSEDEERSLIAQFQFPTISSLIRFTFSRVFEHEMLVAEIIRSNPSVKVMDIVEEGEEDEVSDLKEIRRAMKNLRLREFSQSIRWPGSLSKDDDMI